MGLNLNILQLFFLVNIIFRSSLTKIGIYNIKRDGMGIIIHFIKYFIISPYLLSAEVIKTAPEAYFMEKH